MATIDDVLGSSLTLSRQSWRHPRKTCDAHWTSLLKSKRHNHAPHTCLRRVLQVPTGHSTPMKKQGFGLPNETHCSIEWVSAQSMNWSTLSEAHFPCATRHRHYHEVCYLCSHRMFSVIRSRTLWCLSTTLSTPVSTMNPTSPTPPAQGSDGLRTGSSLLKLRAAQDVLALGRTCLSCSCGECGRTVPKAHGCPQDVMCMAPIPHRDPSHKNRNLRRSPRV